MRSLLIIVSGLILFGVMVGVAKVIARQKGPAYRVIFWLFTLLWIALAGTNMWLGITRAGYSVIEEVPIFIVVVGIPVTIAYLVQRALSR